ncbi:MAG: glycoside/pentoside/hexuronide:cation symporter, family [Chloroflexota bacterium]|nr:glycoside/pentoside/hexuronide:cation symporter, family [Chloroflexota bacterium]
MYKKLSRKTKIVYGFGDLGFSLTTTIIGAYFLFFLTDVVGIQPAVAGIAILVGRTWDYLNDPLIGHLSDRTRSRWGRRRPFLLFGALPFALAFMLMWYRPALDSQAALVVYYSLAYVLFDAAATFVYMPYYALTPELTDDYDERTSLTSYRMFFSIFGSLLAFTVPMMIVGNFTPEAAARVLRMAVIFGGISAVPLWLVFFNTREKEAFVSQEKPKLIASLKAAFKNRPFVFGAVIYLLTWICMDILQTTLLFFIKYVLGMEGQSELLMALIFVTAIAALPFWEFVSRKMNKRLAYAFGIGFWAVTQVILITVGPSVPVSLVYFLCVMAGIGVGAAHVLPWAIIPDAIEWDEYQTGERHEGIFYSLITLMQKVASSIAIPLVGVLLEVTHYQPNSATQPVSAVTGIRMLVGPIPAIFLTIGIIFALKYPLDRTQFTALVDELEIRREKA